MSVITQLCEERAQVVAEARVYTDKAAAEKRGMSAAEQQAFDKAMEKVDDLKGRIDSMKRLQEAERSLEQSNGRQTMPGALITDGAALTTPYDQLRAAPKYYSAFDNYVRKGFDGLRKEDNQAIMEMRDLQADKDIAGGFLTVPKKMVDELIIFVNNLVFMRSLGTIWTVTDAQSLGAPSLDVDMSAPTWTPEIQTGMPDTSMTFGARELHPHDLSKLAKISLKLLRLTSGNAEAILRERLGYQFAITEENAYLNGNGVKQPLGIFYPSAQGIDTSRDIVCSAINGLADADGLIKMKFGLKVQYMNSPSTRWIFSRALVQQIRTLKYLAGTGAYIWQPGLTETADDTVLDTPYVMSEYCPNVFTANSYVAAIGDMKKYWIAEVPGLSVQRLVELYAATNQVGFIGRRAIDGMPVLAEAFIRGKVASS